MPETIIEELPRWLAFFVIFGLPVLGGLAGGFWTLRTLKPTRPRPVNGER